MLKNKNEASKISNIFLFIIGGLSLLSIISLLIRGVDGFEGYNSSDYYFNLIMMVIYLLLSVIVLFITNKKVDMYKDEFSISRRIFNLFIVISIMSVLINISANVLSYFFYDEFSWYSLAIALLGYVPTYIISYIKVSKGDILSKDNETKVNVANLIVIYLLMNYCINVVALILQVIFKLKKFSEVTGGLCLSIVWIIVVIVAYILINNKDKKIIKNKKKK